MIAFLDSSTGVLAVESSIECHHLIHYKNKAMISKQQSRRFRWRARVVFSATPPPLLTCTLPLIPLRPRATKAQPPDSLELHISHHRTDRSTVLLVACSSTALLHIIRASSVCYTHRTVSHCQQGILRLGGVGV
jgi:hypothetical protein